MQQNMQQIGLPINIHQQRGMNLIELMISIVVGLFILAGILSLFVAGQRNSDSTFQFGAMQENGRLALEVISRDLNHSGFFSELTGVPLVLGANFISAGTTFSAEQDCLGAENSTSFPSVNGDYHMIWASETGTGVQDGAMGCINDQDNETKLTANSGILSIKRLAASPTHCSDVQDHRYYLALNHFRAQLYAGSDINASCSGIEAKVPGYQLWRLIHHVYYLDQRQVKNKLYIPQLRRMELTTGGMVLTDGPMAQGIEDMQFIFVVDNNNDGEADSYIQLKDLKTADWDKQNIIAIEVNLLIRSRNISPRSYTNNASYQVGSKQVNVNDQYRRLLLSSVIPLRNQVLSNARQE